MGYIKRVWLLVCALADCLTQHGYIRQYADRTEDTSGGNR